VTNEAEKARDRNVISYRISSYGVKLPCGMNMNEVKVWKVREVLNTVIDNNAK